MNATVVTGSAPTADELCRSATQQLEELCTFHDTFFHLNKQLKQGQILSKVQNIEAIVEKIAEVSSDSSGKYTAQIAYILGKAKNCGDHYSAEAEMYLRRAVKLNIHDINAWNTLAECLWKKTDYVEARECLLSSVTTQPNVEAYCLLSMLVKLMLTPATVAAKIQQSQQQQGGNVAAALTKIDIYGAMIAESIGYAKEAVKLDVCDAKAWYVLGNAWCSRFFSLSLEIHDLQKSLTCYDKAIALMTAATEAAAAVTADGAMISPSMSTSLPATTASASASVVRNRLPNPDVYYNKAVLCFYIQDYMTAEACYLRANAIDPGINPQIPAIVRYIRRYVRSLWVILPVPSTAATATTGSGGGGGTESGTLKSVAGFVLKRKKVLEFVAQVQSAIRAYNSGSVQTQRVLLSVEGVGFAQLMPGVNPGVAIVLKLLQAVNPLHIGSTSTSTTSFAAVAALDSTNGHKRKGEEDTEKEAEEVYTHQHPESTYLALDCTGRCGFISVFHVGSNVSLCDHHASSNVILTVSSPVVRMLPAPETAAPQAAAESSNGSHEVITEVPLVQVFDLSCCLANGKMIAAKKIAANKLNTRTFDS